MITEHSNFIVLTCDECQNKTLDSSLYRLFNEYNNVAKVIGWKVVGPGIHYCWNCIHKNSYDDILTRLREEMDL